MRGVKMWRGLALALWSAAVLPAGAYQVYVTNEKSNNVSVIDSEKLAVVKTVKVGRRPRGVLVSPDGKNLYICASDENGIQVFDLSLIHI